MIACADSVVPSLPARDRVGQTALEVSPDCDLLISGLLHNVALSARSQAHDDHDPMLTPDHVVRS